MTYAPTEQERAAKGLLAGAKYVRDLSGQRFGRFVAMSFVAVRNKNAHWLCRCDCGNDRVVAACDLKTGNSKSCGCLHKEVATARFQTHGGAGRHHKAPEFFCWIAMRGRCYDPRNRRYAIYGGRGITVCDRWRFGEGELTAFACFVADMGPRPSKDHSIDRIDVNGNYEPSNCRWATRKQQACNRRNNRKHLWNGEMRALSEICEIVGAPYGRTRVRMAEGWDLNDALTAPQFARRSK